MAIMKNKQKITERINAISDMAAGKFSLQQVLDQLAQSAATLSNVTASSIRLLSDDGKSLEMKSTYGLSDAYRNKGPVTLDDPVIGEVFKGKEIIVDDMRVDERVVYKDAAAAENIVSQLSVPLRFQEKVIGVLRLYSTNPQNFGEENVAMARLIASQCAISITNAKLYAAAIRGIKINEQMKLAGVIQRRMLPQKTPNMQGFGIAAAYKPCYNVGGDLYDFIQINDDIFVVIIADVMGKGLPAAIMMSMFRGWLRAYTAMLTDCNEHDIHRLIVRLNRMTCRECEVGEFVTLCFAVVNRKEMAVSYCSCGHDPTYMIRNKKVTELNKGGLILGVDPDAEYQVETVPLEPGDVLLFYTDGLIDAENFEGKQWGRKPLLDLLARYDNWSAEVTAGTILAYRRRFTGIAPQADDTTIVCVRVKAE
jgi:phosphoserine phosphatase RsbU/P